MVQPTASQRPDAGRLGCDVEHGVGGCVQIYGAQFSGVQPRGIGLISFPRGFLGVCVQSLLNLLPPTQLRLRASAASLISSPDVSGLHLLDPRVDQPCSTSGFLRRRLGFNKLSIRRASAAHSSNPRSACRLDLSHTYSSYCSFFSPIPLRHSPAPCSSRLLSSLISPLHPIPHPGSSPRGKVGSRTQQTTFSPEPSPLLVTDGPRKHDSFADASFFGHVSYPLARTRKAQRLPSSPFSWSNLDSLVIWQVDVCQSARSGIYYP